MYNRLRHQGFTIIELVIVIALLAVIAGLSLQVFMQYGRYQAYQQTVSEIAFLLVQTQADARVARFDEHHGIYFSSDSITQFRGNQYNASDTNNLVTTFPGVTITPTLTGATNEIRLQKVSALPSATGTISIVGTTYPATTTFSISPAGVIEYE